ncbi:MULTISPECIES: hypothetical protein [unclassified Sphingomonas]|jgi:hypothetical protein|uniref:hypothetical protein n=1 Tax=unclassified Sphingomonas TaxID=196159 RepID=UPI0008374167|nr:MULTISPECIES: hypothetical protein [unclassified Sphingomonas]
MQSQPVEPKQSLHRVRVGVTGLASVLILLLAAGAIYNAARDEPQSAAIGAPKAEVVANIAAPVAEQTPEGAETDEPLAELGVAPSTKAPPASEAAPLPDTDASPVPVE